MPADREKHHPIICTVEAAGRLYKPSLVTLCHVIIGLKCFFCLAAKVARLQEAKRKRKGHFFVFIVNFLNPNCSDFTKNLF